MDNLKKDNRYKWEQHMRFASESDDLSEAEKEWVFFPNSYVPAGRDNCLCSAQITNKFKIVNLKNDRFLLGKVSNELRIRFKSGLSEPDYDQNNFRIYTGYQLLDNSSIWLGYGRDYYKVNSDLFVANDIFMVTVNYDFDLRRKK